MADAPRRGKSSQIPPSGDTGPATTSTRPARLRVMRPEVQEFLKSPRRARPNKQPSPSPPPPREEEKKVKEVVKSPRLHARSNKQATSPPPQREEEEVQQLPSSPRLRTRTNKQSSPPPPREEEKEVKEVVKSPRLRARSNKQPSPPPPRQEEKEEEVVRPEAQQLPKGPRLRARTNKQPAPSPLPPGEEEEEVALPEVPKSHRLRGRPKKQQPPPPPRRPPSPPPPLKEKEQQQEEDEVEQRARYRCAFQDDGAGRGFAPPDLVWGKVRSHPWWPGQVFDAADASEAALRHRSRAAAGAGAPLVAYFWDRTFAWNSPSDLRPFHTNFTKLSTQSTTSAFVSAVDASLQEVGRRVEAGLSCSCFGSSSISTKQEVQNSGIRQGAYGAALDPAYMRDVFGGEAFLDYIVELGRNPLAGADRLDLATAKAQLRAFNRSRGPRDLPEFVFFDGIEDEATLHTKRKRAGKSAAEDDAPRKEKKPRSAAGSSSRLKQTLNDIARKGNNSKGMKSSAKKKISASKYSDGPEKLGVGSSKTPASKTKTVGGVLSESKSGRTLRSTCKQEDALEGLKRMGKETGKNKESASLKENKPGRRMSSARKKGKTTEDGDGLGGSSAKDSASPAKRRERHTENSTSNIVPISEHGTEKKKKLSELTAEAGMPNSGPGSQSRTRGKRSLHESTGKSDDPDCDSKDTANTRKSKKLNTLGDLSSQPQHLSRKKPTKDGELKSKAAGRVSRTPPVVKGIGAAPQTRSRGATKQRQVNSADKAPRSVRVNRSKTDASADSTKKSYASDVNKEVPEKAANTEPTPSEMVPENPANTEPTPSEQPIAEHMQDEYWADILMPQTSKAAGEPTSKAAGRMPQTPPVVKGNDAAPQTRSRRATKHRQVNSADKTPRSVKVNRSKKDARTEEPLPEKAANTEPSPSEEVPEKAANTEPTPTGEVPEKAANTRPTPSEEVPVKAANTVSTPSKEVPENAANTESTPLEQPIADHMKDDYWADILINVEEPLSSLKKKKDSSKKRTNNKTHQFKKVSNSSGKQDTDNGGQLKSESKPFAANGSQANAGTKSAEEMENSLLAGLELHFSRSSAVPSGSDLLKIFSQYGPVSEAKAEIGNNASSAQVIFKRRMDAELAFAGAGKISALGPALVSFRLTDFPASASGNDPSHGASKSK